MTPQSRISGAQNIAPVIIIIAIVSTIGFGSFMLPSSQPGQGLKKKAFEPKVIDGQAE